MKTQKNIQENRSSLRHIFPLKICMVFFFGGGVWLVSSFFKKTLNDGKRKQNNLLQSFMYLNFDLIIWFDLPGDRVSIVVHM